MSPTFRACIRTKPILIREPPCADCCFCPRPASPPGAIAAGPQTTTLPSGVTVETYREGETGSPPTLADVVRVHYQGTLADGKEFDSSYSRGRPAELPLEALVPCWQEVLQQMKPGGAVRIVCPPATAYGSRGVRGKNPARQHAELRDRAARGQALRARRGRALSRLSLASQSIPH